MGINLSGALTFARNALTPGTNAISAKLQADTQAKKDQLSAAMQQMVMERQAKDAALKQALGRANIGHLNAETGALVQPKPGEYETLDTDQGYMRIPKVGPAGAITGPDGKPLHKAKPPVAQGHVVDPVTGEVKFFDPTKPPAALSVHPAPRPTSFTPVTLANPDGTVTVKPFNTKDGTTGPAIGGPKPGAAAGGSASLSSEDREKMLSQAQLDNATMKAYEAKVLSGQAKVGTMAGVAGALADAHGGPASAVTGILANKATGAIDPEYQRYITAQRSYGRIMGNLQSKRYTDHQAEIERSISGLQGNDLGSTIRYKQALRDASLAEPSGAPSASGGRGNPQRDPGGNIHLERGPASAPKKAAKDYGIFGPPGGDE